MVPRHSLLSAMRLAATEHIDVQLHLDRHDLMQHRWLLRRYDHQRHVCQDARLAAWTPRLSCSSRSWRVRAESPSC